jgi:hypothetical protein
MHDFVKKYGYNITSQNNENGIIRECLERINPELKIAVEFGAPDQMYCSNIYPLKEHGWDCYYYDDNTTDPFVTKKKITADNINELPKCSVLSMDTDGCDHDLWLAYNGKPDIVIIEINSSLPPMIEHSSYDKGASYISMLVTGIAKGYFLLAHTGNLIMLLNKHRCLFPEVEGDGIDNYELYFNKSWLQ